MHRTNSPSFAFLACAVIAALACLGNTSWATSESPIYSFTGGLDGAVIAVGGLDHAPPSTWRET